MNVLFSQMQLCACTCAGAYPALLWPGFEWAAAWHWAADRRLGIPDLRDIWVQCLVHNLMFVGIVNNEQLG